MLRITTTLLKRKKGTRRYYHVIRSTAGATDRLAAIPLAAADICAIRRAHLVTAVRDLLQRGLDWYTFMAEIYPCLRGNIPYFVSLYFETFYPSLAVLDFSIRFPAPSLFLERGGSTDSFLTPQLAPSFETEAQRVECLESPVNMAHIRY
jgi:hypothetical protein